eukprot:CAMPEP_0182419664 /NCGR_PEP_ID=MMETSP1167-20130531/4069_1 /TAXON_ID=2988 /ORGANISM="Mallomonas Sp, Strain CCMP3275" /LENGTH=351 /DNA_ID=CAMNT_0024594705 /DNA_START=117 /DNA_END=1172 /DNA_ORIENTATION=+
MGGGISLSPTLEADDVFSRLKRLLANKRNMDLLFNKIASLDKVAGKVDMSTDISHNELLCYFAGKKNSHQLDKNFKTFSTTPEVVNAAFNHIVGKGKKRITKKQFRRVIPTVFLFHELYKLFEVADDTFIDDKRVFRVEFIKAYKIFQDSQDPDPTVKKERRLSGVKLDNISVEQWEKEFDVIDKDKSGFITFDEFCSYAIKNIIDPMDFMDKEAVEEVGKEKEGEGGEGGETGVAKEVLEGEAVIINANGDIVTVQLTPEEIAANTANEGTGDGPGPGADIAVTDADTATVPDQTSDTALATVTADTPPVDAATQGVVTVSVEGGKEKEKEKEKEVSVTGEVSTSLTNEL